MAQVKYTNYDVMKQKLKRSSKLYECLKPYASLSTLLFDTFLRNNGYLSSKDYYGSKFEIPGKNYSDWIHELKEARVIVQYKLDGNRGADFIRFSAGPLIVEYINEEKSKTREIALVDDVPSKAEFETLKADAAELKARMNCVEEAVKELKEASKPPDTKEKQELRKVATDKLAKLAKIEAN
jgi:hypothetical protein